MPHQSTPVLLLAFLLLGAVEPLLSRAQTDEYVEPVPIDTVDPVVSPMTHQSGTVVVRVEVGVDGSVDDVEVVAPFPAFTGPVVDAVRQWRFSPARLEGRPVAARAIVAVHVALVRTTAPPVVR